MVHSDHSRQRCGRASGAVTVLWRCNCLGERFMWLTTKVDTVCDTVFFCMADSWRLCTRFSFPSGRSQPAFSSFRIWSLRPPRRHALSPAQMLHEISIKWLAGLWFRCILSMTYEYIGEYMMYKSWLQHYLFFLGTRTWPISWWGVRSEHSWNSTRKVSP